VHDLRVHLIWITKYRYKVLTKEVDVRTREIIRQACDQNGIQIIKGRVSKDHDLYISYPPKLSVYAAFSSGHVTNEMIQEYLAHKTSTKSSMNNCETHLTG